VSEAKRGCTPSAPCERDDQDYETKQMPHKTSYVLSTERFLGLRMSRSSSISLVADGVPSQSGGRSYLTAPRTVLAGKLVQPPPGLLAILCGFGELRGIHAAAGQRLSRRTDCPVIFRSALSQPPILS